MLVAFVECMLLQATCCRSCVTSSCIVVVCFSEMLTRTMTSANLRLERFVLGAFFEHKLARMMRSKSMPSLHDLPPKWSDSLSDIDNRVAESVLAQVNEGTE